MKPHEIWLDQCEAAREIAAEFGADRAITYLVGEKFINFVSAAETEKEFREELPAFAAEIRDIFERWQLAAYLEVARLAILAAPDQSDSSPLHRPQRGFSRPSRRSARVLLRCKPHPAGTDFACYFCSGGSTLKGNAMNRRSACICFLAFLKTSLVSSVALAAGSVSRIAGPRWNVNGDWSPSLDELRGHLRAAHGIDPGTLGIEDLLTLHDNDHNRRGYQTGHGHKKASKGQSKGYAKF